MLDPNDSHPWWDILKTLSNLIALLLAGGFGWLTRKFTTVEADMEATAKRIDDVEKHLLERTRLAETNIAVLKSYHEANIRRLDSIEGTANKIDTKLDALIIRLSK